MKKILVILVMGVIILVYSLSVRNAGKSQTTEVQKADILTEIEDIKTGLEENYPSSAREVVEKHSELMALAYSSKMTDEAATSYAETIRMLYADKLNQLNPVEAQVARILSEREENQEKPFIVIKSEVLDVTIVKEKEADSDSAQVDVVHKTNQAPVTRKYYLVQENGKWKISTWENQTDNQSEEVDVEE